MPSTSASSQDGLTGARFAILRKQWNRTGRMRYTGREGRGGGEQRDHLPAPRRDRGEDAPEVRRQSWKSRQAARTRVCRAGTIEEEAAQRENFGNEFLLRTDQHSRAREFSRAWKEQRGQIPGLPSPLAEFDPRHPQRELRALYPGRNATLVPNRAVSK